MVNFILRGAVEVAQRMTRFVECGKAAFLLGNNTGFLFGTRYNLY